MKILTAASLCIIASILLSDCSSKESPKSSENDSSSFSLVTLRKRVVHFNNVESGMVVIPRENISKMSAFGKDGNPIYASADIAGSFNASDTIKIADNTGLCIKFTVPRIKLGDYCIVNAKVTFPHEIKLGEKSSLSIDSDYKYDSKAAGQTEYIWFLFDPASPQTKVPGIWKLELSSGGNILTQRNFTITDSK
jgi:hypothetical protein